MTGGRWASTTRGCRAVTDQQDFSSGHANAGSEGLGEPRCCCCECCQGHAPEPSRALARRKRVLPRRQPRTARDTPGTGARQRGPRVNSTRAEAAGRAAAHSPLHHLRGSIPLLRQRGEGGLRCAALRCAALRHQNRQPDKAQHTAPPCLPWQLQTGSRKQKASEREQAGGRPTSPRRPQLPCASRPTTPCRPTTPRARRPAHRRQAPRPARRRARTPALPPQQQQPTASRSAPPCARAANHRPDSSLSALK